MQRLARPRIWVTWLAALGIAGGGDDAWAAPPVRLALAQPRQQQAPAAPPADDEESIPPQAIDAEPAQPGAPPSILSKEVNFIDLDSALRMAGVRNPELMIARQRVVESEALRQWYAAQYLPNLNFGLNYDFHSGPLQQSSGHILSVSRSAIYVGAGANAIAAGTVNIPGVQWNLNVSQTIYNWLVSRQVQRQREYENRATRNQVLKEVAVAYVELLRAAGRRAVAAAIRDDAAHLARITAIYAETGEGKKADADRAATELSRRNTEVLQAEGELLVSSARLAQLLNLDPSVRLYPTDAWVVPQPVVPGPMTINELLVVALVRRPELAAQQAAIRASFQSLQSARVLPFSPQALVGLSAGEFGGGSNLMPMRFGNFAGRNDFDVVTYWTLQNFGIGNLAQINAARARLRIQDYQRLEVLNQVRMEVVDAYARTHASFAQIGTTEQAIRSGHDAFVEDLVRIQNHQGLPIEVLNSLRLWGRARNDYLDAIADYNASQFELYVALGQPPANALARPAPPFGQGEPGGR